MKSMMMKKVTITMVDHHHHPPTIKSMVTYLMDMNIKKVPIVNKVLIVVVCHVHQRIFKNYVTSMIVVMDHSVNV